MDMMLVSCEKSKYRAWLSGNVEFISSSVALTLVDPAGKLYRCCDMRAYSSSTYPMPTPRPVGEAKPLLPLNWRSMLYSKPCHSSYVNKSHHFE